MGASYSRLAPIPALMPPLFSAFVRHTTQLVVLPAALLILTASSAFASTIDVEQLRKVSNGTSLGPLTFSKDTPAPDGRKRLLVSYARGSVLRLAATDAEWKAMVAAAKASASGSGASTASLRYLMSVDSGWVWRGVAYRSDGQFADGAGRLVFASPSSGKDIVRIGALPVDWDKVLTTLGISADTTPPPSTDPPPTTDPPPSGAARPYDSRSPWNTPAPTSGSGSWSQPLAGSSTWISTLSSGGAWTNDNTQYAGPIYRVDLVNSPLVTASSSQYSLKRYGSGDQSPFTSSCTSCQLPIPLGAGPSAGSDGHVILWDQQHGIEIGFWQFAWSGGSVNFANAYYELTGPGNMGTFADGKAGRGAGTPYLAGAVTKEDVQAGVIDHALAAAVTSPGSAYVWPASKSDGAGGTSSPPEGTRLLLDPSFSPSGCSDPTIKMIVPALQKYGVYLVDGSGSNKFYLEDAQTLGFSVPRAAANCIPWSRMRAVAPPAKP